MSTSSATLGGDDFVFLMRSQDWALRLLSLLEDLAASLPNFYDEDHREAGSILARDRDGNERHFALLSASVAVVQIDGNPSVTSEFFADQLRRAKKAAKGQADYSCVLANPEGRTLDLIAGAPGRAMATSTSVAVPLWDVRHCSDLIASGCWSLESQ